jgi:hypothetical protein
VVVVAQRHDYLYLLEAIRSLSAQVLLVLQTARKHKVVMELAHPSLVFLLSVVVAVALEVLQELLMLVEAEVLAVVHTMVLVLVLVLLGKVLLVVH